MSSNSPSQRMEDFVAWNVAAAASEWIYKPDWQLQALASSGLTLKNIRLLNSLLQLKKNGWRRVTLLVQLVPRSLRDVWRMWCIGCRLEQLYRGRKINSWRRRPCLSRPLGKARTIPRLRRGGSYLFPGGRATCRIGSTIVGARLTGTSSESTALAFTAVGCRFCPTRPRLTTERTSATSSSRDWLITDTLMVSW